MPVGLPAATAKAEQAPGPAAAGTPARQAEPSTPPARPVLTAEQAATLERLVPAIASGGFAPFLVHGVTGSGKTEVYLAAIEEVVARGREAIVLVPEISLTPQTIRRFRRRFARVAVLHSHMSDAERHRHWQSIASGEVEVVVGARSAVFAPARRLGLLVIDEEHESSFKQETTPRYHARDVAVKRAQMERIPVILGSATPSLESWHNAERGRYTRLAMPSRVGDRPMPAVEIIDMRNEKTVVGGLSESLRQAMTQALDEGGQVDPAPEPARLPHLRHLPRGAAMSSSATRATWRPRIIKVVTSLICHTCDAERRLPAGLSGLWRQRLALRRHRHGTARARDPRGVSRCGRAADGLGHDALAGQPRASLERVQGGQRPDLAGHSDDRQGAGLSRT